MNPGPYFKFSEPVRYRGRTWTGIQLKPINPHAGKPKFTKNLADNYATMFAGLSDMPKAAVLEMSAQDFLRLIPVADEWVEREYARLTPAGGRC